jgi:hypothetical protein
MLCLKLIFERCIVAPAPDDPSPFIVGALDRFRISNLPAYPAPDELASSISNPAGDAAQETRTPPTAGRDVFRANPFGTTTRAANGLLKLVKVFIFTTFLLYVVVDSVAHDILSNASRVLARCF